MTHNKLTSCKRSRRLSVGDMTRIASITLLLAALSLSSSGCAHRPNTDTSSSQSFEQMRAETERAFELERRADVVFDAQPMMFAGFHKPTWPHRDDTVLDVVQNLLSDGMTSRLYRRLVEKENLAFVAQAANGVPGTRYDNLFMVLAVPGAGASYDKVEKALFEELDRLKTEPVAASELEKAKTRIAAGMIKQLEENGGVCSILATYQIATGEWRTLDKYLDGVQSVTPDEIRAAAARYFVPSNRTIARIVPPAASKTGAKEVQP